MHTLTCYVQPKLASVIFPAVSAVKDSISNPSLQQRTNGQVTAGKCCKGTTVLAKKNLTVKDMKQIPRLKKSDSIKPCDSNQQSSVLSSSGNVSVSRRNIDRSMLLREVRVCYY